MKDIGIIDTGLSNIYSVINAFEMLGSSVGTLKVKGDESNFRSIILPGVGSFKNAMGRLTESGLDDVIKQSILDGKPFLGICLGMQLLLSSSEEFGITQGLNVVNGNVRKFDFQSKDIHIPHVGWNEVINNNNMLLLKNIQLNSMFYFVHSYFVDLGDVKVITGMTNYAEQKFISCFEYENIYATQFHPEKSGKIGIEVCKNFQKIIKNS